MKTPFFGVSSLLVPALAALVLFSLTRNAKGATNLGEALGPFLGMVLGMMFAAIVGETAALLGLIRGERSIWIAWIGVIVNGALLAVPLSYLLRK